MKKHILALVLAIICLGMLNTACQKADEPPEPVPELEQAQEPTPKPTPEPISEPEQETPVDFITKGFKSFNYSCSPDFETALAAYLK